MTILLSIETSTEVASVALLIDQKIIYREITGVQTHSQGILPCVQAILSQADISLKQCDAIAFGCGPGAFTGVRTACGIVQGLAFGADLPILPIISLHAMAFSAYQQLGSPIQENGYDFICALDARMGEVYSAHYRYTNLEWQVIKEPYLTTFEQVLAESNAAILVLGNGLIYPSDLPSKDEVQVINAMPHAEQIAHLALQDFKLLRHQSPEQAQPLYLRNKIALTTIERMALKAKN